MDTVIAYLLTIIIPLIGVGNALIRSRLSDNRNFFSKEYTDVLKGLCCLVVIYVHISPNRGNVLQDAIGSFAYIAVTFFFLVSAYGMMAGIERKQNYLKNFWRNRLVSLLIPCFLLNIVSYVLGLTVKGDASITILYHINGYVVILLQWCLWFYIVMWCKNRWFSKKKILTDWILIAGVVVSSIALYLFVRAEVSAQAGWCFERIGLVWGILLYRYYDKFVGWMDKSRIVKVIFLTLIGGILGLCYLKYKMVYFFGAYLLKVVLGFVLLLLLFTATSNRKFGDVVSNWLGGISYEVYLSHGMVMGYIILFLPSNFNSGAFILLSVVSTLLLSTGIHAIGKPIVKYLRKI